MLDGSSCSRHTMSLRRARLTSIEVESSIQLATAFSRPSMDLLEPFDARRRSWAGVKPLGLEVRAGCHTGEVEREGADVRGIAVHIGARIAALEGPSEVLASSTVKDLVSGSGLEFEELGDHELKGVPDRWRLFRVADE